VPVIPSPPAAGPDPGQPGHFAHHDWLESSVLALDYAVGQVLSGVVVVSATNAVNSTIVTVTFPVGMFPEWPYATAQAIGTTAWLAYFSAGVTSTSAKIGATSKTNTAGTVSNLQVHFHAIGPPEGMGTPAATTTTDAHFWVTCHTEGCRNGGIPVDVGTLESVVDGETVTSTVQCGACGQPVEDLSAEDPAEDSGGDAAEGIATGRTKGRKKS
jgi:hypothetical protein